MPAQATPTTAAPPMADYARRGDTGADSPQFESVYLPDGAVLRSPVPSGSGGGILYATTTESEYGADRVYTGETYSVPARRDPPGSGTRGVLRRSLSSRAGGFALAHDETPAARLKRKVSWAGDTVRGAFPACGCGVLTLRRRRLQNDYTSRASLLSMPSSDTSSVRRASGSTDGYSARASCMTHLLSFLGMGCDPGSSFGLVSGAKSVLPADEEEDGVAARMRRSMSSRGNDMS